MLNFVRTADGEEKTEKLIRGAKLDHLGGAAAFLCAIHCALMPFVVTVLPLLGLSFLASEPVEWGLLALSAALGTGSLCLGYRQHRRRRVLGVLGIALSLLVTGRILHEQSPGWWGPILLVAGGFSMMGAHFFNHRLCHLCPKCQQQGGDSR